MSRLGHVGLALVIMNAVDAAPTLADDPAAVCVLQVVRYRVDPEARKAKLATEYIFAIHATDDRLDPLRYVSLVNSFSSKVERADVSIRNRKGTRLKKKLGDFKEIAVERDGVFVSDWKNLVLELPTLQRGDTLAIRDERTLDPFLGFPLHTFTAGAFPVRRSIFAATIPRNLDPRYRVWNGAGEPQVEEKGNEVDWRWEFEDLPSVVGEPLGPEAPDILPTISIGVNRIAWGRAETWEDVAAGYWEHARPRIRPVSDANLPPRDRSHASVLDRALERVQNNVRYVAIHLGEGDIIPHPTEETLRNKYGDCKDMAAVLISLPEVREVAPALALVQTRGGGVGSTLDPLPTLHFFNHAVACVPSASEIRWLDATHSYGTAANPRADIQGAAALVVSGPHMGFQRIPINPPSCNRTSRHLRLRETAGGWTLDLECQWTGSFAQELTLAHASGTEWPDILRSEFETMECTPRGQFREDQVRVKTSTPDTVRLRTSVAIESPFEGDAPGIRPCWARELFPMSIFAAPERRTDVHWPFLQTISETLTVESTRWASMALQDTSWNFVGSGIEFRAGIATEGGVARFTRSFVISNLVYRAENWAEARDARGRMLRWSSRRLAADE